jgi:hypothetical protein
MKRIWLLTIFAVVSCAGAPAETDIKAVVHVLEARYAIHHQGVPGLWLTKPFLFGAGFGGLKIAEFGNFHVPAGDLAPVRQTIEKELGPEWAPLVETWSKSDGEWALIFAKTNGDSLKVLIASSDHDDGLTLVQVSVSGRAVKSWLDEPAKCAKDLSEGRNDEGDPKGQEKDMTAASEHAPSDAVDSRRP